MTPKLNTSLLLGLASAAWLSFAGSAAGQLPQVANGFLNTFSEQGAPLDPEPPGPTARTGEQFRSGSAFSGWQTTRIKNGVGTIVAGSTSETAGAPGSILIPSYTPTPNGIPDPSETIQLEWAKVGRSLIAGLPSYLLGDPIYPPLRKPNGTPIDPITEPDFYLAQPVNSATGDFYWSPHAQVVFANIPGTIEILWEERISGATFNKRYEVSGTPVKTPKTIYWTERDFNGPVVQVPENRVNDVNVVYSSLFTENVPLWEAVDFDPLNPPDELPPNLEDLTGPYGIGGPDGLPDNPLDPAGTLPIDTKTLWYSTSDKAIHAYNIEGRVLVELLGNLREPERIYREHLGFEIVDVIKEVRPAELRVAIGEKVLPSQVDDEAQLPEEEKLLVADAVAGGLLEAEPFLYEHLSLGGSKRTLYAVRETQQIVVSDLNGDGLVNHLDEQLGNEVLIYWKESGIMQLLWPKKYAGYIFKWPEDFPYRLADSENPATEEDLRNLYTMYARPEDGNDSEVTGVQLNSADNPVVAYQDDPTRQHAQITPQNVFFTVLGEGNRTLIRYTDGDKIWFERIYSQENRDFPGYESTIHIPVGTRFAPPAGIASAVGYIRPTRDDLPYNPGAYLDPFVHGLEAAAEGAIIGVNALPGNDEMEVWWYEPNSPVDATFSASYFPSQVRRYHLILPASPDATLAGPASELIGAVGGIASYERDIAAILNAVGGGVRVAGVLNVDQKDATFILDVDLTEKTEGDAELLWETGDDTTGWALTYESDSTLRLGLKASGTLHAGSYALSEEELEDGFLQLAWTIDLSVPEMKLLVNGVVKMTTALPGVTDWSSDNEAGLGVQGGIEVPAESNNAFGIPLTFFSSGTIDVKPGLRLHADMVLSVIPRFLDEDGDALPDVWESEFFLGDLTQLAWGQDLDGDLLNDEDEYRKFWNPADTDTDDDGTTDNLETNPFPKQLVLASNAGSGELGIPATGTIYRQNDPLLPGYNPNEEHALMSNGVAWALRDDLNTPTSSDPFVLVDYTAENGRPAMVFREVVRENGQFTFNYEAPVGVILQAPMPLPVIALPIDDLGDLKNTEVGTPTDLPNGSAPAFAHYDSFTYSDRKGATWIYRGPHGEDVNVGSVDDPTKNFKMHYFYKTAPEFDFPGLTTPEVGTIVPYLSQGPISDPLEANTPLNVTFTPIWPSNPPVLGVAETLALPKRGLPAVRGQVSARVLYEQSIADNIAVQTRSAKLIDPTRAKVYEFSTAPGELAEIPGSIATSDYLGKTYFPNLPPHLSERFYVDPNIGTDGALVFIGEFIDAPVGEKYFLLNVMSDDGNPPDMDDDPGNDDEVDVAKKLCATDDTDKAEWDAAIEGLSTTLETFKEDPALRGTYIVDEDLDVAVGPTEIAEIISDNTAVDSYAISAAGGGTGYVVLATGDGEAFTPSGSPVALHVFKVAPPLYRGELKVIASANPLDEKLSLQHSSDYAGDPSDYEFAWITSLPVGGLPLDIYSFAGLEVFPNSPARSWAFLNNPAPGYESARDYFFDDSSWSVTGALASNQLEINDGNGTAANGTTLPNAILRDTFDRTAPVPIDLYLSLDIADNDGAVIYLNGAELAVWNVPGRVNSVPASPPGTIDGQTLQRVFQVAAESLQPQNTVTVDLYTSSDPGALSFFDLRLDSQTETESLTGWNDLTVGATSGLGEVGKMRHTIEGSSLLTLTDNYLTMRYRPLPGTPAEQALIDSGLTDPEDRWSRWLPQQLAEGWIKRALAGINPFDQRLTDLFNNAVNTDVSLLTQAGARWEGDIALNLANIDDFGLIEIYETILRRGKGLSIDGAPPLNVPAANDALLLAAGYLNDLYLLVGNEAFADAANPTIAFSTDSGEFGTSAQFGDLNTALFAFKGQLATVLDEELGLLRGRDDTLQPRVTVAPFYNRLFWNFTNGINSGEAVYALNYNIKDLTGPPDLPPGVPDGAANAHDAVIQFPQGHGDAYGHYLTALKVYYGLLHSPNFAWEPRIEAVLVLDQPVSIDYQDERKFATAAAALARTASQTLDLTYRKEFTANENVGWEHLTDGETNSSTGVTRRWGTDEWATRGGLGTYFHWVTANSILPAEDTVNEGIQKVDRTTVPELDEVAVQADAIQLTLDNADARLNPLGLSKGALSFDISPSEIDAGKTHYEQIYDRAIGALRNAKFAFDNAKNSTQLLRRQEDSLDDRRYAINVQEQAYENDLVELYGTPYPDDIGPGKTYVQGYNGPDLLHYQDIDTVELFFGPTDTFDEVVLPLDPRFIASNSTILNYSLDENGEIPSPPPPGNITFSINSHDEFVKPNGWAGRRAHPGLIQTAVSDVLSARLTLRQAADDYVDFLERVDDSLDVYATVVAARQKSVELAGNLNTSVNLQEAATLAQSVKERTIKVKIENAKEIAQGVIGLFPTTNGFSNDFTSSVRGALQLAFAAVKAKYAFEELNVVNDLEEGRADIEKLKRKLVIDLEEQSWTAENRQLIRNLQNEMFDFQDQSYVVDRALRDYDQAQRDLQALVARGLVIQKEREVTRKRSAAIVQGYRTRDLAFRVFRNEALEKYKALFDLSARYTYLAARAYDYETGLLDTSGSSAAAGFFDGIVQSRALGVLDANGDPQFSASTTGDPGLAGVLAEMQGDWSVAQSRLGFNNPDNYETTFSLRQENSRIIPAAAGDEDWRDELASRRMPNILDDPDVRRYCMQVANADGLPVPGLVIPFQSTIADGANFFGQALAGGDHTFSPTSFATKIRSSGIAFKGYVGMDSPTSTSGPIESSGGTSPPDPDLGFLDPDALSATPYIYLIPAGVDSMRSPPLGDTSTVRSWSVDDQAIPLPFNIGNTNFSTNDAFISSESLSEDPFAIRKHQAFRAVPSGTVFSGSDGFTNSRLIGRSAWNSNWKIVIPGKTLRANPNTGLDVFLESVTDIELFLQTYSYSGN